MNRVIFILFILAFLISCGSQRRLVKSYNGKPVTVLNDKFGNPVSVIDNQEDSILIYEVTEELKSTEISQGKVTLDPIYTPQVKKTERFYFTIKNGVVSGVRAEEEYERE